MKCLRRSWQLPSPRLAGVAASPRTWRRVALAGPIAPPPATRPSGSGAPLSLNDIIAFESQLPSVVAQETNQKPDVDQLISRASRVLQEVNDILAVEAPQPQTSSQTLKQQPQPRPPQQQRDANAATGTAAGAGAASEPGAVLFGSSAEVSERQALLTRRALQRTLEVPATAPQAGGPPPSTQQPSASRPSSSAAGSAFPSPSSSVATSGSVLRAPGGGSAMQAAAVGASSSSSSSSSNRDRSSSPERASGGVTTGAPGGSGTPASDQPAWTQALFSSPPSSSSSSSLPTRSSSPPPASPASPPSSSSSSSSSSSPLSRPLQPSRGATDGPMRSQPASSTAPAPASAPAPAPVPAALPRRALPAWAPLAFAEADLSVPSELRLKSEESLFAERARTAVLPPLQSVVELTSAARPPSQGLGNLEQQAETAAAGTAVEEVGVPVSEQAAALARRLEDGAGRLADGTRFEKLSGTDRGPDGYVKRWEVLRGVTGDGRVQWEECWWEASSRYGLRELGAFKKGCSEAGGAWVEEWKEVMYPQTDNLRLVIERTAHKWARDDNADEWEEKWGERFEESGRVHKWADKWAKAGSNVWHERWGEDYDGQGACQKWTDKWAERLLPEGGQEQWGDKWTETFGHGRGTKHGEVWSSSSGGQRYNRWWNEEHYGDGRVRKWGNSTSGEFWDTTEQGDTYYNPVPHFGFQHAVSHSPQLWAVPLPPPEESEDGGLGMGVGRL